MLKKIGIIFGIILLIVVIGFGILVYRLAGMAHNIEGELNRVAAVNLKTITNGTYYGSYGDFIVASSVEVVVKNHKITSIKILDQNCGKGYEALGTIDRILKAQTPKVDAVTGASYSSRTIMIAVGRALKNVR